MKPLEPLPMLASCGPTLISSTLLPLHRRQQANPAPLTFTENGVIFEVQVQLGDQTFHLTPDTGSSDLWVPTTDFQCVDPETGDEVPQADCRFGGTYRVPESTEYEANQTFGVQYGTGIATGKVGHADVTVNGITVPRQKVGLVDRTNDVGDGIGSGILGLGFPPLTSAHPGTELDNTTLLLDRAVYDPVFVSMYKLGLVEPWYSFAIERPPVPPANANANATTTTGPGGWLGLGELPPVPHADDWAVKPIEVTEGLSDEFTGGKREISLMTLTVDGVSWVDGRNGSSRAANTTAFQAVVDTGQHMNLVPASVADQVNDAFDPPGVFDEGLEVYVVDCDVKTPELGITLDGRTFWHRSPEDLVYRDVSGFCYSSVGPTGEDGGLSLNFLGDAFLRNVVSVFDFGKEELRFAARSDGEDTEEQPIQESGVSERGVPGGLFIAHVIACAAILVAGL